MTDWDKRYQEGFYSGPLQPHQLVRRFWSMVPEGRPVLDIAMGTGRDLFLFAEKGCFCCGLDRSWEGIRMALREAAERGVEIFPIYGDAYRLPFKKGSAGAVLVFDFLIREMMGDLPSLLSPGGILLYETFLKHQNNVDGPHNPDYLLHDGELIGYFRGLDLLFYEEGVYLFNGRKRAVARYVGRKR
ncbi:MAG TPA: class I SAM-dependent methyltransferase [Syntrophorhabdales bacterium]|nr:class I SAM-dependent methyltransferase [Syntrophorhabdales bacterium]